MFTLFVNGTEVRPNYPTDKINNVVIDLFNFPNICGKSIYDNINNTIGNLYI